ncbi:hypothetical protein AAMO2058_001576500 [Amorphochlora amoebiformis]
MTSKLPRTVIQGQEGEDVKDIKIGQVVESRVSAGRFGYFRVKHTDMTKLLRIRAEPVDCQSDPDLFVSNREYKFANKRMYTWKSCLVGKDRVDIHPTDAKATPGDYTIGIFGYNDLTYFRLKTSLIDPPPLHHLHANKDINVTGPGYPQAPLDGYPHRVSFHYVYDVSVAKKNATVFVTVTPFSHQTHLQIYASNAILLPDCSFSRWRANGVGVPVSFKFDTEDFKHSPQKKCFISIYASFPTTKKSKGEIAPEAKSPKSGVIFRIFSEVVNEEDRLPPDFKPRLKRWRALYDTVDGGKVSQTERRRISAEKEKAFTYGEVEFVSFLEILRSAKPNPGETFYDLGSGTGKAVIAAHLLEDFKQVHGIELLEGLHKSAVDILNKFGDNKQMWKVIYFDEQFYQELGKRFKLMKKGARVITLKMDNIPELKLLIRKSYKMSWGRCTVYVLERM